MITQQTITATVAAGATGATADTEIVHGEIVKVDMDVTGASMDINLDSLGEQKAQAILNITGNTDTTYYPQTEAVDNAGASLDASDSEGGPVKKFTPFVVYGKLRLTLANAAAAETVTMTITYRT
jgi:hypothetical protein